jgi:uroporphyrinogen III methyltransferase/synthase
VVVTRTRAQASELADRLTRLGAAVVELPVIAVVDPLDGGAALAAQCARLAAGEFTWVVCTSVNAVTRLIDALGPREVPPSVRWAAVGAGTARALAQAGHRPDLVPAVSVSTALADEFPEAGDRTSGRVLFPRAEVVQGQVADQLEAKGWTVEEVVAYRTVAGAPDPAAVEEAAGSDVIAFTSSSTVTRSLELLGSDRIPPLVVTIGPVTSDTARLAGLPVAAEAQPHSLAGLVDAVVDAVVAAGDPGRTDRP